MKKFIIILAIIVGSGAVLAAIGGGAYYYYTKTNSPVIETNSNANSSSLIPEAAAHSFATWQAPTVTINPQVASYTVKSDLSNIENKELAEYWTNSAALSKLVSQNFVVTSGSGKEFFSLYESNRYDYVPSFITSDSVLHTYHLYFNYLLENLEKEYLIAEAKTLTADMLAASKTQYAQLKDTDWADAALRNVGFFSVADKLLNPDASVDPLVKDKVEAELALITAHSGITGSPLWNEQLLEDYSQYIVRGHYTKSAELGRYFQAMMWYGRLSFRVKEADEVKSAALITQALNDETIFTNWDKIYEPTNFFVGKSDDISYYEFQPVLAAVYGEDYSLSDFTDVGKFTTLWAQAKELEGPKINSMPVAAVSAGGNPDLAVETKAFRFMGQRYTIDADVFQNLICRQVGNKDGTLECPNPEAGSRMLPKGLDIPAAMGSAQALSILTDLGETEYAKYPENMQTLQNYISGLTDDIWTQNLYWGWMYTLKPLTQAKPAGYPSFMTNSAWQDKQLVTYLGSWTELKHDTILYAKQVYAELGGGPIEQKDDRGYVEPQPELYARLAALLNLTKDGLQLRGIAASADLENLSKLAELVNQLQTISEKELANTKLTDAEYELIRAYGGSLEHFWLDTMSAEEKQDKSSIDLLVDNPAPLVTDVATDPNGQVLEQATGNINQIYAVVPVDGALRLARGGVYSQYEFTVDLAGRLTDEAWRTQLDNGEAPAVADWQKTFYVDSLYSQ